MNPRKLTQESYLEKRFGFFNNFYGLSSSSNQYSRRCPEDQLLTLLLIEILDLDACKPRRRRLSASKTQHIEVGHIVRDVGDGDRTSDPFCIVGSEKRTRRR